MVKEGRLQVRVSSEDESKIEANKKKLGYDNNSSYLRDLLLQQDLISRKDELFKKQICEIEYVIGVLQRIIATIIDSTKESTNNDLKSTSGGTENE